MQRCSVLSYAWHTSMRASPLLEKTRSRDLRDGSGPSRHSMLARREQILRQASNRLVTAATAQ